MKNGLSILSWSLYDLANQFFALNVVSLYFVRWLTLEKQMPEIFYSISFAVSTFFVAISAPLLGAISDITARRKPFLVSLTLISIIFTMLLGVDNIFIALLFFVIANYGCQTAVVFYNALMVNIAPKDKTGMVSGIGRVFGYSGAIMALYLIKPIVLRQGYQATFFPSGLLFLIFSLPCMLFIKDERTKTKLNLIYFLKKDRIVEIFKMLRTTAFDTYKYPGLLDFLKAMFFCLCVVNVVILFMSVYATKVFGFDEAAVINLIAFSTIFAIIGSFFSGLASDYIGYKRTLNIVFILWTISLLSGTFAKGVYLYWIVGGLVGITLGSTWVVSRAMVIQLIPGEKICEVFGLFNLGGYLSAIVGTTFWGVILLFLSPLGEMGYRIALFSLNLFMLFGFIFLRRIPAKRKNW